MDSDNEHKKTADLVENNVEPDKKPRHSFNKYFLYTLVAGLVISALISVVAVLIGEFNSTMSRALSTTGSMVVHAIIALFLVSLSSKSKNKVDNFLLNVLLLITIASFVTSILGIWEVITGRWTADLYAIYFYTFWASLWTQLLLKVGSNPLDRPTAVVSYTAISFTVLFYLLVVPTIFVHYPDKMPEFYYRIMAASVILLATASVLTTVFRRIYLFKHHEVKSPDKPNQPAWDILIAAAALILGVPIIFALIATLSSYHNSSDYGDNTYDTPARTLPSESPKPHNVFPKSKTTGVAVDCSKQSGFESPAVLQYAETFTYVSDDLAAGEITLARATDGSIMQPIASDKIVLYVDSSCDYINSNTVEAGDSVKLYLKVGYTNFYKDALVYVQKLM